MSIGGSVWTICNSRSSSKTPTLRRDRGVGQVETPLVGNVEGNDRVTDVSLFHTGANPLDGSGAKRIRDGVPCLRTVEMRDTTPPPPRRRMVQTPLLTGVLVHKPTRSRGPGVDRTSLTVIQE